MIRILINIQSDGLEAYRRELLALVRDLRQLEQGSPFRFDIIGYPAGESAISVISRPSYRSVADLLARTHRDISPSVYSSRIAGGGPLPSRVEAALPLVQSMRQEAIREYMRGQMPAVKSRSQYQLEYAVAKAIFSPARIAALRSQP